MKKTLLLLVAALIYSAAGAQEMTDRELLASIIAAECNTCTQMEQYYVGSVVLNRVDHAKFPNSILAVLDQPKQFHGYKTRWFEPTESTQKVADDLLSGKGRDYTIVYFYNPETSYWKFVRDMEPCTSHKMQDHFYAEYCD